MFGVECVGLQQPESSVYGFRVSIFRVLGLLRFGGSGYLGFLIILLHTNVYYYTTILLSVILL